jgi:hypothetical protein
VGAFMFLANEESVILWCNKILPCKGVYGNIFPNTIKDGEGGTQTNSHPEFLLRFRTEKNRKKYFTKF